ncbi:MAG: glycosyltransferase [bacterium]
MKICVVSYHTSPLTPAGSGKSGGMNILIANLYKHLAKTCGKSCEVEIFVYGNKKSCALTDNIRVIYLDQSNSRDFAEAIIYCHNRSKYDILHTHYWLSGLIGMAVRKKIHIPWIHSFHTIERFKGAIKDKSRVEVENEISRKCDFIISPTVKESFNLKRLYPGVNAMTLPHGVDTARFRPSPNGHSTLLFVGRVDPIKGLDILIDALREIGKKVQLNVIGGPSKGKKNLENIKAYAQDLEVNFIGQVKHEQLLKYYQNAGIVIIPSYYESFGLVGLEAMASARPVIGFQDTGLAETVGSDAGLLVKRNKTILAKAIVRLIDNQELRYQMGTTGRKKAHMFNWRHIANRYLRAYEEISKK